MAKLGEEDPRWIVSDRPDGTNINGWHWEETNKMTFCKDYFESQLNTEQNVSFGEKWFRLVSETFGNKSNVVVRKFSISNASVEGECSVSTRKKGKKFGVFDFKVTRQYEVEVECMVKTKKKKKKEEENVDGLDGEEEEEAAGRLLGEPFSMVAFFSGSLLSRGHDPYKSTFQSG